MTSAGGAAHSGDTRTRKHRCESADEWLSHRFNQTWDELQTAQAALADAQQALAQAERDRAWIETQLGLATSFISVAQFEKLMERRAALAGSSDEQAENA